jgi:hypothetical protein
VRHGRIARVATHRQRFGREPGRLVEAAIQHRERRARTVACHWYSGSRVRAARKSQLLDVVRGRRDLAALELAQDARQLRAVHDAVDAELDAEPVDLVREREPLVDRARARAAPSAG